MSQCGVRFLLVSGFLWMSQSDVRVLVDVTVWCQGSCGCHSLVSGFLWMSQSGVRVLLVSQSDVRVLVDVTV